MKTPLRQLASALGCLIVASPFFASHCRADLALLRTHCGQCHAGKMPKGDFSLQDLKQRPEEENADVWVSSLQRIRDGEMPPAKHNHLSARDKVALEQFLQRHIADYESQAQHPTTTPPRRLNNREFENSVRDVLMIDHIGSHDPLAMLLGDTLHDGFDTHGETLGMSEYHLDQYVTAIRRVLDAVIVSDQLRANKRPRSKRYEVTSDLLHNVDTANRQRKENTTRSAIGVEIRGTRIRTYAENFKAVPQTGRYRITVRAKALDRHVYSQDRTGIYDGDPLVLRMHLGNRTEDFELEEGDLQEFTKSFWLAEGTPLEFSHHTDGLRMIGNGNFKFQNRIAHDFIKENHPDLYQRVVTEEVPKAKNRSTSPSHWVHWVKYWQGPRPVIAGLTIEGPLFDSWPPQRQVALLGETPQVSDAAAILQPIAERAWRRTVSDEELAPVVALVESQASNLGDVGALKEGIVAILVSPSFLLLNSEDTKPQDRFATKFSYLLGSTTPDAKLFAKVRAGQLDSFDAICQEIRDRIDGQTADEFLREFPYAWLQLDRINFMAPDVDRYPLYEKKNISTDMVDEVLAFFRHNVQHNRPVPELLFADYSFINADLAKVYELDDVQNTSELRKYTFGDGRRGGFLGMGAFLTLTADTLSTSPIHRAVYVMENFMGIHPAPPPADVEITEPDIRAAKTIREVIQAHRDEATCAACHRNIDPFGFAFENFDPIGAWRDDYVDVAQDAETIAGTKRSEQPIRIPIDASATFPDGQQYTDILQFRQLMQTEMNQKRFVRCFVTKLLTYANGTEPQNFTAIDRIVQQSAEHDYKIVETIAAVVHSPLFRETHP